MNIVQDDVPVTYALKVIFSVSYWLWDTHNLATDQSLDQWSSAGCWPRFNQTLLQLIDVSHWFLINMFLRVGFSRCLQVLVHWCGFHAARFGSEPPSVEDDVDVWRYAIVSCMPETTTTMRGESEWCILLWCLAAQTVAARHLSSCWRLLLSSVPRVPKSAELLRHKTPDFTPDVASQHARPQFCRLQIIESHSGMHLSETARDVEHRWWALQLLLTEWHIFHKVGQKHPSE